MADTVVIAEETLDEALHFSWGLAIAGGVTAAAMLFFLLTLGSGFGLLLFRPATGGTPSAPVFLTGGAIYFLAAQLFSFAFGGHLVGRLLAPAFETREHEEFRAAAHGFVSWAVALFGTLIVAVIASLSAMDSVSHLYAPAMAKSEPAGPTAYLVDKLFRPSPSTAAPASTPDGIASSIVQSAVAPVADPASTARARDEAGRILDVAAAHGGLTSDDRARLIGLVGQQAGLPSDAAAARVDSEQANAQTAIRQAADIARKTASYAALWIAVSLLFGALISMTAAVFARFEEDDIAAGRRV